MDAASGFFVEALLLQAAFTAAVVLLVGRRYPARLRTYRLVAPAAVPVLLFAFVVYGYVALYTAQGLTPQGAAIARFALAYAVLWLVGVLWAGLLIRLVLRRR